MSSSGGGGQLGVIRDLLVQRAGGFFRNVRWEEGLTCPLCAGVPKEGFPTCYLCDGWIGRADLADRVGFMTYAVNTMQSGHTMYTYKDPVPSQTAQQTLALLAAHAISRHKACIDEPFGPATVWAVVPSFKGRTVLADMLRPILNGQGLVEARLEARPGVEKQRGLDPANVNAAATWGAHVLLIEDTWVGGGSAQSSAAALKSAGAGAVTTLVMARWLERSRGRTADLIGSIAKVPFDPDRCPFTGDYCS
jgi:hypothetical protein